MSDMSHDGHGPDKGLKRWLFATNHKDIGTMYLVFAFIMLFVGGAMSLVIRAELFQPGLQFVNPEFFNQMITLHALVMVFGMIMPAFAGFANWMIPMMIGAPDMALPRLNNWSFWILPFAILLLASTLFMPGGAPASGWTLYPPLVLQTIINMRTTNTTMLKMPLFVWAWLLTAYLLLEVMPVLAGGVTMLLMDQFFGTSFFLAAGGGDPVLFQHIFWFFGHPEVYIIILPAFGIISQVIPTFSRKPLFGHDAMVYATASIAFLSFIVWAHHMFTVGMPLAGQLFFMLATMLIAVPTGVKIFNWIATMWKGALTFETPMLFAIAFLFMFTIGGFSGVMMAIVPLDFQYHDSYFIVAHFHYVLVPGALFAAIAGVYYWIPKWTGYMYDETLGKIHFWLSSIFVNLTFFPQHFVGLAGMPRRIPDYAVQFADFNAMSSIGAFGFGFSQLLFLYIVIKCVRGGKQATGPVWDNPPGLEWTLPSPAPYHTFDEEPAVK